MKPNIFELALYSIFNFVPYALIALYPFRTQLRFSRKSTVALLAVCTLLQFLLFLCGLVYFPSCSEQFSLLSSLADIIFFVAAVKSRPGRLLFNLLMILNIANFTVVAAKCIEGILFPAYVRSLYHWTYSLCMIVIQLCTLVPFFFYIRHFTINKIRNNQTASLWKYAWTIPATFYLVWFYAFYHVSDSSSLDMALQPKNTVFNLLIVCGQLVVYTVVAQTVFQNETVRLLEEKQHQLSIVTLQYEQITKNINETRQLRHDLRHHMTMMKQFLESKHYAELEAYLTAYTKSFPVIPKIKYCTNQPLNILLGYYHQCCAKAEIDFSTNLMIPDELPLNDMETAVLFGNLLENALEACSQQKSGSRKILFSGKFMHNQFIFAIDNTFDHDISRSSKGLFFSTKHEGEGIGTVSAKEITLSHNGYFHIEVQPPLFCVSIMLPLAETAS